MDIDFTKNTPMITVITDASFCPDTYAAGWGGWIVCDGARLKIGGPIRYPVKNSTEAELAALLNGIVKGIRRFANTGLHVKVLIQSDNIGALEWFRQKNRTTPFHKECFKIYAAIKAQYDFELETRHVKGHSDSRKGARFYVNNWCDNVAGNHMREERKKRKHRRHISKTSKQRRVR